MAEDAPPSTYEATLRRQGRVLAGIGLTLLIGALALVGVFLSTEAASTETMLTIVLIIFGLVIFGFLASLFSALRSHRWTIEANALNIEERPRVPLTGRTVRRIVPYREIVALRRVESGFDHLIELERSNGAVHRLAQKLVRPAGGGPRAVHDIAGLEAFEGAIRARMAAIGVAVPKPSQGLSLWNKPLGLVVLGLLLVATTAIAALAIWAVWLGADVNGVKVKGVVLVIILPVGVLYFIVRAWRRRRHVLGQR